MANYPSLVTHNGSPLEFLREGIPKGKNQGIPIAFPFPCFPDFENRETGKF
jgi:hypothetical protein